MSNVSLDTTEVGQSSLFVAAEGERLCKSFHSYERRAPPEFFATDFHQFLFSLPQLWNLTRSLGGGNIINERKYAVYIKAQRNRSVYLSSISIPMTYLQPFKQQQGREQGQFG